MATTERTPTTTALPVTLAAAKGHLRISFNDDDTSIETMIRSAAADVEAMCGLALLSTTITHTTDDCPGATIGLPVGPIAAGEVPTVEAIATDGTLTALTGWWLSTGRYPVLHLDSPPTGPMRVTYSAGYGADASTVPGDLSLAIAEQAARLFEQRAGIQDKGPALSPHTARVIARYRQVKI